MSERIVITLICAATVAVAAYGAHRINIHYDRVIKTWAHPIGDKIIQDARDIDAANARGDYVTAHDKAVEGLWLIYEQDAAYQCALDEIPRPTPKGGAE